MCSRINLEKSMETFTLAVAGWHDFYIMIGTAAATLIGLLFVGLSLNADMITRKENADLRILAAQTFTDFILVLMFAVLFLIPLQGPRGLGLPLLGIDGIGLYVTVRRFLEMRRSQPRVWGRSGLVRRFAIPMICFTTLMIIAVTVLLGEPRGLYWLVPVMILLIWDACMNAWDLVLRLREQPAEA
jgi:hypothetical protein